MASRPVMHIDPDWLELDKLNCDFIWSERKYPDPAGMFRELAAKGFQVSIWELPYIDTASPVPAYEQMRTQIQAMVASGALAERALPDGQWICFSKRGILDASEGAGTGLQ